METRNSDASLLADSFESIASSIAAGVYKDYNSILTATRNANRLAISSKNEWAPWFAKLASKLEASFSDGSIKTQDQVQLAWREIAYGLKKASK
jgi:hypothetical protein